MGRIILVILASAVPSVSLAHPGHLVDVAGHNHWVAGAAIGVAIAVGIWAGLKGRKGEAASADGGTDGQSDATGESETA